MYCTEPANAFMAEGQRELPTLNFGLSENCIFVRKFVSNP